MPTNLPPEYFDSEKKYKAAKTTADKITCLEELISTIPKHKGTDKLRADLRRRLSKLKASVQTKKKVGKHESLFHIEKEGAGRVVIVGPPNVGKSSLLNVLTHATPKVSEYPFTTHLPTPGMMTFENVQIQLIDTPPLTREHIETELMDLIRNADLILMVVDLQSDPIQQLHDTSDILITNRILLKCFVNTNEQRKVVNLIPSVVVVNKLDNQLFEEDFQMFRELLEQECFYIAISTKTGNNLEQLKKLIFQELEIIRIYSKRPGRKPDFNEPFVMKKGGTIEEFAEKVHKDFLQKLKSARVWGAGVYDGQLVGRDHVLVDGDVVELHN